MPIAATSRMAEVRDAWGGTTFHDFSIFSESFMGIVECAPVVIQPHDSRRARRE